LSTRKTNRKEKRKWKERWDGEEKNILEKTSDTVNHQSEGIRCSQDSQKGYLSFIITQNGKITLFFYKEKEVFFYIKR